MEINIVSVNSIKIIPECNQVEVLFNTESGVCHYRVFEQNDKEAFIADIENPAFGGVEGAAQPFLIQLGWN